MQARGITASLPLYPLPPTYHLSKIIHDFNVDSYTTSLAVRYTVRVPIGS